MFFYRDPEEAEKEAAEAETAAIENAAAPRISPLLARATTPRSAVRPARTGARAVRLAVTGVLPAMRRVPLIGARPRRLLSALTGVPLLPPPTKVGRLRGNTLGFLSCHPTSRECVGGQEGG